MSRRGTDVIVNWTHPETEEDYLVACRVSGGDPGRTYGPPESCYPPESPDVEVLSVEHDGGPQAGEQDDDAEAYLYESDKELARVEDDAVENAADNHRDAYEAAREARDDARRDR